MLTGVRAMGRGTCKFSSKKKKKKKQRSLLFRLYYRSCFYSTTTFLVVIKHVKYSELLTKTKQFLFPNPGKDYLVVVAHEGPSGVLGP